jgi:Flp pilus assembly protein TadG
MRLINQAAQNQFRHKAACLPVSHKNPASRRRSIVGQTMVEFAFVLPLLLILMLGVLQMILVGGAALAVNEAAAASARYAALNPSADESTIDSYLRSIASPLISDSNLHRAVLEPSGTPRHTGTPISVTVTYDMGAKLFLGTSFFGITFPDHVSVTQTMTSE